MAIFYNTVIVTALNTLTIYISMSEHEYSSNVSVENFSFVRNNFLFVLEKHCVSMYIKIYMSNDKAVIKQQHLRNQKKKR